VEITVVPRGVFTHEMLETLKLWGVRVDRHARPTLPHPDAKEIFARTLGAELRAGISAPPPLVVAPAGDRDALLGALSEWPSVRGVALVAADEELPDLPFGDGVPVTRAQAAAARARVARELGLLTGHAAAAAAVYAHEHGGVALVTSPGERE